MNEQIKQGELQEKQNNGNNPINPSRFKTTPAEPRRFDELRGKLSTTIGKQSLIPDDKNKPNLYR